MLVRPCYKQALAISFLSAFAFSQPVEALDLNVDVGGVSAGASVGSGGVSAGASVGNSHTGSVSATANVGSAHSAPTHGVGVGACVGINSNCTGAASSQNAAATTRTRQPADGGGNAPTMTADDFIGLIVRSSDNRVLGIIENARIRPDGTVAVQLQVSNTLTPSVDRVTFRIRPSRIDGDQLSLGMTARQFVAQFT